MKKITGFTLIEVLILLVVSSLLASTILLTIGTAAQKMPGLSQNTIALQSARKCIEWFIGQRRLNGYSSVTFPSSTVPTFCTKPSGYTLTVNIVCTTINTDANYKTITVTVGGLGNAALSTLIASY